MENEIPIGRGIMGFSDGTVLEVEYDNAAVRVCRLPDMLQSKASGSSSNYYSWVDMTARQDLILESVEVPFEELFGERFSLKINGVDYRDIKDMKLNKGERLLAEGAFTPDQTTEDYMTEIHLLPVFHLRGLDGSPYESIYLNADKTSEPFSCGFFELVRFLKEGGNAE